ncbi:MAG TPA: hypothetical protein DD990_20170 [Cyanobacteria bacterium UBA11368]|nr:hypothetical protein [Cyanobacteria bacterium UBA11368]
MFRNRFFSNYFSPLLRYISSLVAPRPRTPGEVVVFCESEQAVFTRIVQANEVVQIFDESGNVSINLSTIAISKIQTIRPIQILQS